MPAPPLGFCFMDQVGTWEARKEGTPGKAEQGLQHPRSQGRLPFARDKLLNKNPPPRRSPLCEGGGEEHPHHWVFKGRSGTHGESSGLPTAGAQHTAACAYLAVPSAPGKQRGRYQRATSGVGLGNIWEEALSRARKNAV